MFARRVDMSAQLMVLKSHVAQVRRRAVQGFCFQNQVQNQVFRIFLSKKEFTRFKITKTSYFQDDLADGLAKTKLLVG